MGPWRIGLDFENTFKLKLNFRIFNFSNLQELFHVYLESRDAVLTVTFNKMSGLEENCFGRLARW